MQVSTIAEQLFFTTVKIETIAMNGERGAGTGFFCSHIVDEKNYLFIVTNKHVVDGQREGALYFHKEYDGQPKLGDGINLTISPEDWSEMWFGHPDENVDIVICPLVPILSFIKSQFGFKVFFRSVETSMIPNAEQIQQLDAVEPVTFIGYPNGVWDRKNLLPVARRGTTASPIEVDFEGEPCFLIDASVFGGSSGSPVFIFNQGSFSTKSGGFLLESRLHFVGVIAAVFFRTEINEIISVPIPTQLQPIVKNQEMIDLGIVFKSRTVVEVIEEFLTSRVFSVRDLSDRPKLE